MDKLKSSTNEKESSQSRNLLDLGAGNRQKLERAFKTLVGTRPVPTAPVIDVRLTNYLKELGFVVEGNNFRHPTFSGRVVTLPQGEQADPLQVAIKLATSNFPETEFHLPFIMTRAKLEAQARKNGQTHREPEPEYDEDGFLEQL